MNPLEALKQERERISAMMHQDPMEVRTWFCAPLLVIDRSDGSVAFSGDTNVEVTPREDGTADLIADGNRDGWHPSLVAAKVKKFTSGMGLPYRSGVGTRDGLRCTGADSDGFHFTWHINGAADDYWLRRQPGFDASTLPPEEPPEE